MITSVDGALPTDDAGWDVLALAAVQRTKAGRPFVPGLGHPVHKQGDPRTPTLIRIATEEGTYGPHLALFEAIGRVHDQVLGRRLPLNGAGVCGAALADLGLPVELLQGFRPAGPHRRAAGASSPRSDGTRSAWRVYREVDGHAVYERPDEQED